MNKIITFLFLILISCGNINSSETDSPTTITTTFPSISSLKCDIWKQDCSDDRKCTVEGWTRNVCKEYGKNQKGELCQIFETYTSGDDSCDKGLICIADGKEEFQGTCVEFCTGTKEEPICSDGKKCEILNDGLMPLCV